MTSSQCKHQGNVITLASADLLTCWGVTACISGPMYFVTGASGALGKELVRKIRNEREPAQVIEILRVKSEQIVNESQIYMDLKAFDSKTLALTIDYLKPQKKIVLVLLAAGSDQDSNALDIFQINYFSAIQICDVFDTYCERNKIPLQCIFALSAVALTPHIQKPFYSASKAALYNYVKYRLKIKNSYSITCGIFLGPFRSKLWDVDRMKKFSSITLLFRRNFTSTSKAKLILKKIDNEKSGIFYHPTSLFNMLVSFSQVMTRRKLDHG